MTTTPTIYGPTDAEMCGKRGLRYWVDHPFRFCENDEVNARLSAYPVFVFFPSNNRPANETPIVFGLQGLCAPLEWNACLVETVVNMNMACVLFDTPLSGERSLIRTHNADLAGETLSVVSRGVALDVNVLHGATLCVNRDFLTIREQILASRHGLTSDRVCLFGISLGAILSSSAFIHLGLGQRLLVVIGHPDIPRFAGSFAGWILPTMASTPLGAIAAWLMRTRGWTSEGWLHLLRLLKELMNLGSRTPGDPAAAFLDLGKLAKTVDPSRRARFLVGADDPCVVPQDAIRAASMFPNGEAYVVPGLRHGTTSFGPDFWGHIRFYLQTQLGDWQ